MVKKHVLLSPVSFADGKVQWALVQNLCACCLTMNHSLKKMVGSNAADSALWNVEHMAMHPQENRQLTIISKIEARCSIVNTGFIF